MFDVWQLCRLTSISLVRSLSLPILLRALVRKGCAHLEQLSLEAKVSVFCVYISVCVFLYTHLCVSMESQDCWLVGQMYVATKAIISWLDATTV